VHTKGLLEIQMTPFCSAILSKICLASTGMVVKWLFSKSNSFNAVKFSSGSTGNSLRRLLSNFKVFRLEAMEANASLSMLEIWFSANDR